jgi:hypothetical protein
MNHNDYDRIYRYVCDLCTIGIEVRSRDAIPHDPVCLVCGNKITMTSYFGPTGEAMHA